MPGVGVVLSGPELTCQQGTRGLLQRWFLLGSVSILDITCQPAGAFGTKMQGVPVEVLSRCATVSDKGRVVVYAPHTFTLA